MCQGKQGLGPALEVLLKRIPKFLVNPPVSFVSLEAVDNVCVNVARSVPLRIVNLEGLAVQSFIIVELVIVLQFLSSLEFSHDNCWARCTEG